MKGYGWVYWKQVPSGTAMRPLAVVVEKEEEWYESGDFLWCRRLRFIVESHHHHHHHHPTRWDCFRTSPGKQSYLPWRQNRFRSNPLYVLPRRARLATNLARLLRPRYLAKRGFKNNRSRVEKRRRPNDDLAQHNPVRTRTLFHFGYTLSFIKCFHFLEIVSILLETVSIFWKQFGNNWIQWRG